MGCEEAQPLEDRRQTFEKRDFPPSYPGKRIEETGATSGLPRGIDPSGTHTLMTYEGPKSMKSDVAFSAHVAQDEKVYWLVPGRFRLFR